MIGLPKIPSAETATEEWLAWKAGRISGHDAATLCGVNPYKTRRQLYDRIVHGIRDQKSEDDLKFLGWRLSLEKNVADVYAADSGFSLRDVGSKYYADDPRIISSADREIIGTSETDGDGILEIKTRDPQVWRRLKMGGLPDADFAQIQHYMMVNDCLWGELCEADVSSGKQIVVRVERSLDFQAALFERIQEFFTACDARQRPADDSPGVDPIRLPTVDSGEVTAVETLEEEIVKRFSDLVEAMNVSHNIFDEAKAYKAQVDDAVKALMSENNIDVAEGFGTRIYYREQAGRKTLDKKRLASAHPEIDLDEFTKQGANFRTLRIYNTDSTPRIAG